MCSLQWLSLLGLFVMLTCGDLLYFNLPGKNVKSKECDNAATRHRNQNNQKHQNQKWFKRLSIRQQIFDVLSKRKCRIFRWRHDNTFHFVDYYFRRFVESVDIFDAPKPFERNNSFFWTIFAHLKNNKICLQQVSKICRETVFRTKEAAAWAASYNAMQDKIIYIFLCTHTRLKWHFAFIGLYECNSKM